MAYRCAACNLAVIVEDNTIIKACSCDAPIIAEMQATAKGTGSVKNGI
jgi:hypothetical protein